MADVVTRTIAPLPAGTALARFLHVLTESRSDLLWGQQIVEQRSVPRPGMDASALWSTTPQVGKALELCIKAAIAPGTVTDATWASPLVQSRLAEDALTAMRGVSIIDALAPRCRKVPFGVKIPRSLSTSPVGAWLPESQPIPFTSLTYDSVALASTKLGTAVGMTYELLTAGTPASYQIVTRDLLTGLALAIDRLLLDPTVVAAPGKPASITNGATAITSTGSTAAAIAADLASLEAAITTGATGATWIMRPMTMAKVAAALGAASDLPRNLHAFPVIVSSNSPAQITLVDAAAILLADDGGFDVGVTKEATPQMDSAPMSPPDATVVNRPLWQQNEVAVKAIRWINWLRAATGAVSYMAVSY